MIQANELRKGNLLKCNGCLCEVGGMSYSDFDDDFDMQWLGLIALEETELYFNRQHFYTNGNFAEPIPLTPEILKACGFAYNFDRGYYFDLKNEYSFNSLSSTGKQIELFDRSGLNCSFQTIQFLHQLQNLYFALTGEELNIEL